MDKKTALSDMEFQELVNLIEDIIDEYEKSSDTKERKELSDEYKEVAKQINEQSGTKLYNLNI